MAHQSRALTGSCGWLAPFDRINAVAPGPIATDMTAETRSIPERRDYLLNGIPMGRFGEAVEVAAPNLFLLSDAASYMTGQVVSVDGGYTAQ